MRHRNLCKADSSGERRQRFLVRGVAIAVDQHDSHGSNARRMRFTEQRFRGVDIEPTHQIAMCADPLIDFDHALVEQCRQVDAPCKELRAILIGDAQRIGKTARDHQRRPLAAPFQQRVRCDRRSHFHRAD